MHLVVWFILSPLILHKYRTTMSMPGPFEEEAFSPQRCANIHNRLLQHAVVNNPSAVIERNLISKFLEVAPEFAEIPHLESLPLYSFFSLLDTTSLPHGQVAPLTPEIYEPDPTAFWSEGFSHEPGIILLYGQNNGDSPMDGGLFLDLQTCKAVWHWNSGPFPAPEKWVLLETALQYQLDKWESGKYYWDAVTKSLATKRWIERDITNALAAWDSLLLTIEAKMQQGGQRVHSRLEPLEAESMSSFQIDSFAKTFLSRARRPSFRHVAPGISTFSPETLHQIYSSEPVDSFRRTFGLGEPDQEDWASLLLPGTGTVPQDVSQSPHFETKSFDKDWGFGKFTVNRRAGLYTEPDDVNADSFRLIANSGLTTACQFNGRCPWGPSRAPRLSEIFLYWESLIKSDTWTVDADGVMDNGWDLVSSSFVKDGVYSLPWQERQINTYHI